MRTSLRRPLAALAVVVTAAALTACSSAASDEPDESAAGTTDASAAWPRTITHELGETTVDTQPENVVSTSLTLTGTLLAIDAPVTASAATSPSGSADENGFFTQWADVAVERGVEVLYPNLELDLEAVVAADPDLIVVSTTGADSTADAYDELSDIAPTIALDYSDKSWQDLAAELGVATGLEDQAAQTVADFEQAVADTKDAITVPEGTTNAVVFNGGGNDTAFAKPQGSHGLLLSELGFDVVGADEALDTSESPRTDFAFVSLENTVQALTGETVFLVAGTEETKDALLAEPVLANAPAVTSGAVYPLGDDSFRMDFYSASNVLESVQGYFG